jgi:hypothetical protein
MDGVSVDGTDLGINGRRAMIDTGTTMLYIPLDDAITIHDRILGAKRYNPDTFTVPCRSTSRVAFTFGGRLFEIKPMDLAIVPVHMNNPTDCFSGIVPGARDGSWLVCVR